MKNAFYSYIHYLIHPFESHKALLNKSGPKGFMRLSEYESLAMSWVFVVLNGIFQITILNFLLVFVVDLASSSEYDLESLFNISGLSTYSFVILSTVLDVIFYPLFGILIIQFWQMVLNIFGKALKVEGELHQKTSDVIAVSFSSQALQIIPIVGSSLSFLAKLISMYAGLRVQLKASPLLSVIVLMTPILLILATLSFFLFLAIILIY